MFRFSRIASCGLRQGRPGHHYQSSNSGRRPSFVTASVVLGSAAVIVSSSTSMVLCESTPTSSSLPVLVTELPSDLDLSKCKVTLYQFESCPFCRKARAVLDLCNIPYEVVEVNPLTKSETKTFAADYKKVPIVVVRDNDSGKSFQIRDSKVIINSILNSSRVKMGGENKSTPLPAPSSLNDQVKLDASTYEGMSIDEAWVTWVEKYLLQLVVVNIYGTMEESRETFDYLLTHKDFGWVAREASYWAGSIVMNQVARSRLKKYNHIQGRHREAFFEACVDLGKAAKQGGGFLGGSLPSSADLNAYGVIRSLEGTRSLSNAIAGAAGVEFAEWYMKMNEAVGVSKMTSKVNATKRGK